MQVYIINGVFDNGRGMRSGSLVFSGNTVAECFEDALVSWRGSFGEPPHSGRAEASVDELDAVSQAQVLEVIQNALVQDWDSE